MQKVVEVQDTDDRLNLFPEELIATSVVRDHSLPSQIAAEARPTGNRASSEFALSAKRLSSLPTPMQNALDTHDTSLPLLSTAGIGTVAHLRGKPSPPPSRLGVPFPVGPSKPTSALQK